MVRQYFDRQVFPNFIETVSPYDVYVQFLSNDGWFKGSSNKQISIVAITDLDIFYRLSRL